MAETYRAVAFDEYGPAEVLHVTRFDVPVPRADRLRVRVRAAAVNPFDHKLRSGAMADSVKVKFPRVPGVDFAGVVDAVGDEVTGVEVGEEIFGSTVTGCWAEIAVAAPDMIARKPSGVSWDVAATLAGPICTAYTALGALSLTPGETVLINAAAGGVGTVATQVAVHRGLRVIGTASYRNHDYLRSLGAIPVAYGEGMVECVNSIGAVDAAFDVSGRDELPDLIALTGNRDRVVTIADPRADQWGVRFVSGGPRENPGALDDAAQLVLDGKLTVPITGEYSLDEAAAAQRESESGHVRGKLVIRP